MKRLLILSFAVGSGHTQAAEALRESCEKNHPGVEVRHVDLSQKIHPLYKKLFSDWYGSIVVLVPFLWAGLYALMGTRLLKRLHDCALRCLLSWEKNPVDALVLSWRPDQIICTHFSARDLLLFSKNQVVRATPRSIVLTDFDVHALWLGAPKDRYFVGAEAMKEKLIERGIPEHNIIVSGIPVRPAFLEYKEKKDLLQKYALPDSEEILLFLSGGEGLVRLDKIIQKLFSTQKARTIIAIAGKNETLLKKLQRLSPPEHIVFRPLGWVEAIDEYMRLATVIITKSGGMTTAECMALGKPMVVIDPIPGQEEKNLQFILSRHAGFAAKNAEDIEECLSLLLHRKEEGYKEKKNAAKIILDAVLEKNKR